MNNRTPFYGSMASRFRRNAFLRVLTVVMLLPSLMTWTIPIANANPEGGIVVNGFVNIGSGAGGNLQITQWTQSAIVNWDSFSIGVNELTQFVQPNVNSAILNRVKGGSVSNIQGALRGNGNVFVINPNGIVIGAGGTIDVNGLVLSTLDVSNWEFLVKGDQVFKGTGNAGITNMGRINAIGGDVFLIGKTVTNSGAVSASKGTVGFASGEEVLLMANPNSNGERVFVRATGSGVGGTGIMNDGTIEGAAVELKSHGNMYALAINNKGSIRATRASNFGGRVTLRGMAGTVRNSGTIKASAPSAGGAARILIQSAYAKVDGMIDASGDVGGSVRIAATNSAEIDGSINVSGSAGVGGSVIVEGASVALKSGSEINASGFTGGGKVNVGGGFQGRDGSIANSDTVTVEANVSISVDAINNGDGGTAVVWADHDTLFDGEVMARGAGSGKGGFVEVSGKQRLMFDGLVNASAESGKSGTVLFDPGTVHVGSGTGALGTSMIGVSSVNAILDTNTNVTIATESGDIIFDHVGGDIRNASVQWNTDASLGVFASGDVSFNDNARTAGAGSVSVIAGWTGAEADGLILANAPEVAWTTYVAAGQFGIDDGDIATGNGSVHINKATNTWGVEVGSRYGTTNVAGLDVNIIGGAGGGDHAHLGFRDNGQVFYFTSNNYNGLATAGDPLVGLVGVNENNANTLLATGVYLFDSTGARTDLPVLAYSDSFASSHNGNWWWRKLDGTAGGSSGRGDYLPEMGAGSSANPADINVEARGALNVVAGTTGDYEGAYAQVGHGGNARGWSQVNRRDAGRDYSLNWGSASTFSASIGRLADVFGDINIRTGLDAGLNPTLAAGTVSLEAGNSGGPRVNNNYAQIGHMGLSQSGSATGEINVLAGGAIGLESGNSWRNQAQIGHAASGGNTYANPRMGVGTLADTGQTPDGKLGGWTT